MTSKVFSNSDFGKRGRRFRCQEEGDGKGGGGGAARRRGGTGGSAPAFSQGP